MPAYLERKSLGRTRERLIALAAVACIQFALGFALLTGLRVSFVHPAEFAQRVVDFTLPPPPPPPAPPKKTKDRSSAPKTEPAPLGGSPGPKPAHAPPSVTPTVAINPSAAPSGGGTGSGPAAGSGAGGGSGGNGFGAGGHDLELLSGDITPSDYPRKLAKAGIGGTVGMRGTVTVTGRVTNCVVVRSSGNAELDVLTCRLIEQRFIYRPATDRNGRPVPDVVEIEWTWD